MDIYLYDGHAEGILNFSSITLIDEDILDDLYSSDKLFDLNFYPIYNFGNRIVCIIMRGSIISMLQFRKRILMFDSFALI